MDKLFAVRHPTQPDQYRHKAEPTAGKGRGSWGKLCLKALYATQAGADKTATEHGGTVVSFSVSAD